MSLLIVFIDTDYTFNLGWFLYQYAICSCFMLDGPKFPVITFLMCVTRSPPVCIGKLILQIYP